MICGLPFCEKDLRLVTELLEWIRLLGGCHDHRCLLIADAAVPWWRANELITLARESFASAQLISTEHSEDNWKEGSNALFLTTAQWIEENGAQPWLWLEPDAIPLKPQWLDIIGAVYHQSKTPFIGFIYEFTNPEPPVAPFKLMSGIAVYPGDAWSRLVKVIKFSPNVAFDVACAPVTVPEGSHTNLIQHFYGESGLPPTFVSRQTSETPKNAYGLDKIHKNAVLFHRCKDGSLTRLLREQLFPNSKRFIVVLSFCNKDVELALKNIQWQADLGKYKQDTILLAYEAGTRLVPQIEEEARQCYGRVLRYAYPSPPSGNFVSATKHVFRNIAFFIEQHIQQAWLWFEPDMVALKRNWLDRLQEEYIRGHQPFMGPMVRGMSHFNGTAVYPADTYTRCPSLGVDNQDAWDTGLVEARGQVMDASHLIQHAWVMVNGQCEPHGYGDMPHFNTPADVFRCIMDSALLFHRDKTLSLADRLREIGV